MDLSNLKRDIEIAIFESVNLEQISAILRESKEHGISQSDATELIESMRIYASEEHEDRLLEILDIATGFCSEKYKVW